MSRGKVLRTLWGQPVDAVPAPARSDGSAASQVQTRPSWLTRVLDGRYRVLARIGAGGMGAVTASSMSAWEKSPR